MNTLTLKALTQRNRRKAGLISILLSSLALGCSSSGKKEISGEQRAIMQIQVANGALLEGDPTAALAYLHRAEKISPKLPELHYSKALAHFARKELKEAISSAKTATQLRPSFSAANNTLGKLYMDVGKFHSARAYLQRAAGDPLYLESFKPMTSLGILNYKEGKYGLAKKWLEKAIHSRPEAACVAHLYIGHLSLKNSQVEKAISSYGNATRHSCGNFAEAHLALGIAFTRAKEYRKAKRKLLEVKRLFPGTDVAERASEQLRYIP